MPRQLSNPMEGEISGAEAEELTRLEAAADARFEEERVSLRWARGALATVREAARLQGVPYQTYIKQVAFRQAGHRSEGRHHSGYPTLSVAGSVESLVSPVVPRATLTAAAAATSQTCRRATSVLPDGEPVTVTRTFVKPRRAAARR